METRQLEALPSLRRSYAKAALGPVIPGGGGTDLPDHALEVRGVEVDADELVAYSRVCGFALRDSLPVTHPHILGFPLQMALMTERSFPFPLLGMVHIANRIEQRAAIPRDARLDVRVWAENLRPHRRGRQFDFVTEVGRDADVAWREESTYLRRGGGGDGGGDGQGDRDGDGGAEGGSEQIGRRHLATSAVWRVPGDIGRRYASVSGDPNPIHMHSLTGRALGFPGAIAHGMWSLARCLAAFEGRVPDAQISAAEFRAPLVIPGRVRLRIGPEDGGQRFVLEAPDAGRVHLDGTISPL